MMLARTGRLAVTWREGETEGETERKRERGVGALRGPTGSIDRDKQDQTQEAGWTALEAGSTEFYTFTWEIFKHENQQKITEDSVNPVHLHLNFQIKARQRQKTSHQF